MATVSMSDPLKNLQREIESLVEQIAGVTDPEKRRIWEDALFEKRMQMERLQGKPWSDISGLRYGPPPGSALIPSVTGYGTSYDAIPKVGSLWPGDTGGAWADLKVDVKPDGTVKVTNKGPSTMFTDNFISRVESGETPVGEAKAEIAHSKREKGVKAIMDAEDEVSRRYGTPTPRDEYLAATKAFQAEKAAIPEKAPTKSNLGDINVDDPYDPTGKRAKAGIAGVDFSGKFSRALPLGLGLGLSAALAPEEVWAAPFSQEGLQYGLESATGISPAGLVSDPRDYAPWSGGVARDVVGGLGQLTRDVLETRDVQPGEPYSGMGDAPNKFDAGHPGMMGVTDVIPAVTTNPYSEAGVPMSNENLTFFGAAPVPTSPSMRDVDYSQALADAGIAEVATDNPLLPSHLGGSYLGGPGGADLSDAQKDVMTHLAGYGIGDIAYRPSGASLYNNLQQQAYLDWTNFNQIPYDETPGRRFSLSGLMQRRDNPDILFNQALNPDNPHYGLGTGQQVLMDMINNQIIEESIETSRKTPGFESTDEAITDMVMSNPNLVLDEGSLAAAVNLADKNRKSIYNEFPRHIYNENCRKQKQLR